MRHGGHWTLLYFPLTETGTYFRALGRVMRFYLHFPGITPVAVLTTHEKEKQKDGEWSQVAAAVISAENEGSEQRENNEKQSESKYSLRLN